MTWWFWIWPLLNVGASLWNALVARKNSRTAAENARLASKLKLLAGEATTNASANIANASTNVEVAGRLRRIVESAGGLVPPQARKKSPPN